MQRLTVNLAEVLPQTASSYRTSSASPFSHLSLSVSAPVTTFVNATSIASSQSGLSEAAYSDLSIDSSTFRARFNAKVFFFWLPTGN